MRVLTTKKSISESGGLGLPCHLLPHPRLPDLQLVVELVVVVLLEEGLHVLVLEVAKLFPDAPPILLALPVGRGPPVAPVLDQAPGHSPLPLHHAQVGHLAPQPYPLAECFQQGGPEYGGDQHYEEHHRDDEVRVFPLHLQPQCEGDHSPHHPRVPAHLQLGLLEGEGLPPKVVDSGQKVYHDCPHEGEEEQKEGSKADRAAVPANAKQGGPEVGVDEGLRDVADGFEGEAGPPLGLLGDVHEGVVSHDDGAGEEGDDAGKAEELSDEVGDVADEEDEAGLLDGVAVEGLVDLEEVAEPEPENSPDCEAEEGEHQEVEHHPEDCLDASLRQCYSRPFSSLSYSSATVRQSTMATASLMMPSPKRTALRTGNFQGWVRWQYLDEGHGRHGVGGADDCAEEHDFLEGEGGTEDEPVAEVAEGADADEADDGAGHSQEGDDAEVLEEEGLAEGVASREDDGGQDDGEEDVVVEGDLAPEALSGGSGTQVTKTAVRVPMRMATEDSCRKGIWLREGYLFDLDQVRSQHVHHQDQDEDERLDRELLRHSLSLLLLRPILRYSYQYSDICYHQNIRNQLPKLNSQNKAQVMRSLTIPEARENSKISSSMVVLERSEDNPLIQLKPLPLRHLQEHVLEGPPPPAQVLPQHLREQHLGPSLELESLHSQLSHLLCCHQVDSTLKQLHVFGGERRGDGVGHKDCEFLDSAIPGPDNPGDEGPVRLYFCLFHLLLDGPVDFLLLLGAKGGERVVLGVELVGGEVEDVEPVVVPGGDPGLGHVLLHGVVGKKREVADSDAPAALDDRLAFAGEGKVAVEAVPHSELLGCAYYRCVDTVTHKHARLASPHKDEAVLALVNVDAGSGVEEADGALLAVRNLELLHVELPGFPHQLLEPPTLQQEVLPPQLLLHEHILLYLPKAIPRALRARIGRVRGVALNRVGGWWSIIIQHMLNTLSGGSSLPREVLQWLDMLDLSYAVRNPRMDLSNGFLIAEMLSRKFPQELSILTFYNAQRKDRKIDNWQQIQKFLHRKKFKVSKEEFESIVNMGPETAQSFLFRLYEFMTGQKLNIDRRLASTLPAPEEPLYKQPTASYAAKDRELHRVVDLREKEARTVMRLTQQKNMIHTQKYNTGLIEWLIEKRKDEIEREVGRQKEEIEKRTRSFANNESKVEVREIELKCFNSSTSKKPKGDFGDLAESKGVLDFLAESAALLLKKDSIASDLKKFGIELKDKDGSGLNAVVELFGRCGEEDSKGNLKVTADTLNRLLELFRKTSEVNLIVENIHNNFIDYRKFFSLLLPLLRAYDKDSETHKLAVSLLSAVARSLLKVEPESAEMMFEEVLLPELIRIAENEHKRPLAANLILEFVRRESECYLSLVQRVKEVCAGNVRSYVALLAHLLEKIARDCEDIQYTLWSEFFYYGFLALNNPAPSVRTNGAKILARLFSDVVVANNEIVGEKLSALKGVVGDPWWEVRAQGLIIFKAILVSKFKQSSSSADINEDLNMKTILHYISDIFRPDVSHNILRIGLIELAELILHEESLCGRYLEILLHVGPQIRNDVLNTSVIKFGPVVYGANTFTYKLTGAPLIWNSLGLAKVLAQHMHAQRLQSLGKAHLEILFATVSKTGNFIQNYPEWLKIYEQFKEQLFRTLLDEDLCGLGLGIIKEFLETEPIHADVIAASRSQLSLLLSKVYGEGSDSEVKANLLELFRYLNQSEGEYTYKIIKDFAEREKTKYLSSNLVDFMNDLTRERRKRLFHE